MLLKPYPLPHQAKGSTLLEVLVSFFLTGLALAGLISSLSKGTILEKQNFYRDISTSIINDTFQYMHANPEGIRDGFYTHSDILTSATNMGSWNNQYLNDFNACFNAPGICTIQQRTYADLHVLRNKISKHLPQKGAYYSIDILAPTSGSLENFYEVTLTIAWFDGSDEFEDSFSDNFCDEANQVICNQISAGFTIK